MFPFTLPSLSELTWYFPILLSPSPSTGGMDRSQTPTLFFPLCSCFFALVCWGFFGTGFLKFFFFGLSLFLTSEVE